MWRVMGWACNEKETATLDGSISGADTIEERVGHDGCVLGGCERLDD